MLILMNDIELAQHTVHIVAHAIVRGVGQQVDHMTIEPTDIFVDRHVVVVQYDQQVVGVGGGIVQPFECHAATHSTVPDEGDDTPILILESSCYSHAQCCRYGVGRMPSSKGVVFTLRGDGEASQPAPSTQRVEVTTTSCEDLVYVGLMPDVPDDAVFGSIKDVVHRHGDLYGTEVGAEMPWYHGESREHEATDLLTELWELIGAEPS